MNMLVLIGSAMAFFGSGLIISYVIWPHTTIGIFERLFYSWLISLVVFPLSVLITTSIFSHNLTIGIVSAFLITLVISVSIIFYRTAPHSDEQQ